MKFTQPSVTKKFLFILTAMLSLVVFLFIITEITFRITRPIKPTVSMGVPDPTFHHLLKPNCKRIDTGDVAVEFSTNSHGFKTREFSIKKPEDVYRIVVLGDSFCFGTGVENNKIFCSLLEDKLDNGEIKKIEVINCGIGSYSPILEYLLLKYKVINYNPDLVMVFYDFSDLHDDLLYLKYALYDKNGELVACNPLYINGHLDYIQIAKKHSVFFSFLYGKLSKFISKIQKIGLKEYFIMHLQGKRIKVKTTEFDRYFIFRENTSKTTAQYYWKNSEIWLDKIKRALDEKKINFILISYPYGLQVSPIAWRTGRGVWNFAQNKLYDSSTPFEIIEDYAKKRGIKFINLCPYLLKYSNEELYFSFDGHWTTIGHQRVAEGILNNHIFKEIVNQHE